ncbi:N-acylethanolamine-hydrolyzing acid amidase-like [Gigantopelta aegis]|uniref:N-acylethanolamine-hydrolyzing acid amidase-like n=1 Tax=Gigantopelta aegis TaxID=1735272 RepID=UPI001B889FC2|nr:N-acylethanolamine-hydrolyzing acid amidase-like [Gigantopelta aegis]
MAGAYIGLLCLICGVFFAVLGKPSDPQVPRAYNVSLDDPPESRWDHVLKDYVNEVPNLIATVRSLVPIQYLPVVEDLAVDLESYMPSPFPQELRGIAEAFTMDIGDIVLLNIIYDVTAFCTSIVSQDSNGTIWHARNLDFYYGDILRNMTIVVNFQKNGSTLYSATTYAGYVGIATGQRPHGYTVTVDTRGHHVHVGYWWENAIMAFFDKSSWFVTFLVRQVLETVPKYSDAVSRLALEPIHAPVYFIVGGTKRDEGVVITRDRIAAVNRMYMDVLQGRWYVLETNYDHWTTPPPYDAKRRATAIKAMNALGMSGVNMTSLYGVLSTVPVLNENTTYSIVFSAAHPDISKTWIRWPNTTHRANYT